MTTYYSTTSTNTSAGGSWWSRSPYYPYYQTFSIYEPSKNRGSPPPPKEMPKMTDEEFDAAFKDLLFGQDTKPVEKNEQA